MSTPRVLVAVIDDHPVFRHGLAHAVTEAPDMELVAAAASVEDYEARKSAVAPTRPPDIVILDLGLPGKRGAAAVEHICGLGSKVLVVSADGSQEAVVDAVGAGAPGYLTKSSEPYEVLVALRTIANGITYVSAALATFLVRSHRKDPDDCAVGAHPARARGAPAIGGRFHRRRDRDGALHRDIDGPRAPRPDP